MGSINVTRDEKSGKKKNKIVSIDGGVGGLVVLGGAMTVAICMVIATAFCGQKNSRSANLEKVEEELDCGCSSEDDDIVSQRQQRSFDDQHSKPTHQGSCCSRCGRPNISTNHEEPQLTSERSRILDKLSPKSKDESSTYDHQEMLLSSDYPYFSGEKLDHSESLMSEETAKMKDSFVKLRKTHEAEAEAETGTENDVTVELNNVSKNERSSETNSTLHKGQGMTLKKDEIVKEDINDGTGRDCHENTKGLKILNKEVIKKYMAESPDHSNHPVGLRVRIFFMMLLSIPFLILFLTYTAAFYLDNHGFIAIA